MNLLRKALLVLAVTATSACDLALDPNSDLEGYYDYAGIVRDNPGHSVNGQLDIRRGFGGDADIDVDWNFYEGSRRIIHVETVRSVPAYVGSDGRIEFTVEGTLTLADGTRTDFRLTHEGQRDGSRGLRGTWELITDLPSEDNGTFTARR